MPKHLLAFLALLIPGHVLAASDCKLIRIEEWAVRMERNLPVIDGEINGNKVGILIDTGSERSFITRSAVNRMTLNRANVGTTGLESARIDELRIGPAKRRHWGVLVSPGQVFAPELVSLVLATTSLPPSTSSSTCRTAPCGYSSHAIAPAARSPTGATRERAKRSCRAIPRCWSAWPSMAGRSSRSSTRAPASRR